MPKFGLLNRQFGTISGADRAVFQPNSPDNEKTLEHLSMAKERETTTQERAERFMMDPAKELSPRGVGPTTEEINGGGKKARQESAGEARRQAPRGYTDE